MPAYHHKLKIGVVIDTARDFKSRFNLNDEQCAELSPQIQVDATVDTLRELGHHVDLIGSIFELVRRLNKVQPGVPAPWDLVFNLAEGVFHTAREAQVPALLEAYDIPFTFSDAATMAICMDKAMTKLKLQASGIPTAQFFLIPANRADSTTCKQLADGQIRLCCDHQQVTFSSFPLFIKPNSEGSSMGIDENSKLKSLSELQAAIDRLATRFPKQELLIETYLAGTELSVGLLGTGQNARVLGSLVTVPRNHSQGTMRPNGSQEDGMNHIKNGWDGSAESNDFLTYEDKQGAGAKPVHEHIESWQVADAEKVALEAHRALGLRDCSRFDIRYDKPGPDAKPYIMEVNTIPGLVPEYSAMTVLGLSCGMDFAQLLYEIVASAKERIRLS